MVKQGKIFATLRGDECFPSLKKTLFSDDMTDNLVAVGKICDDGYVEVVRKRMHEDF